jgi:P-type Ca2+ transporter type 2C
VPDARPGDDALRTGLSAAEAATRLATEGYNDLPASRRRRPLAIAREVVREPMFALLLGAGALYAILGDLGESLMLLLFATISVTIAIIQEGRSERVLEALRDLTSPRALVVRDGERVRIPGREVTRGDLLVLGEGDRIPADAWLVAGSDLGVSESLLTGESVPVRKEPARQPAAVPAAADHAAMLYAGTLIVSGSGLALVVATGPRSEVGRLGLTMRDIVPEVPRLQAQTRRLVVSFAIAGAVISVLAVLLYGWLRGEWVQALLGGIALGMSMLPEEFPLVLTVFMVMGAWRLSRSRVLTRRASAIETLGAATVLCTDKTGTLTCNSMSVVRLEAGSECWRAGDATAAAAIPAALAPLLHAAALASDPLGHDPMDLALTAMQAQAAAAPGAGERVRIYPLRRELLAVTHVWDQPGAATLRVAAKGAPEAIARLCRLDERERAAMMQRVDALAGEGIRVLAVAEGAVPRQQLPADAAQLALGLVGLVGFADPLRAAVPAAVRECREAGIRVVMITGDYPPTAQAIAREAGLAQGECLSGAQLDALSDTALAQRVPQVTVFARIAPLQKLRIVNALKANGEIVAMTGDGVNDAAALKAAHIGVAMGGRGTDVAREAASLVLLDDDFSSMVRAIRHGRRIYDNLRKAMVYILAVHLPIAGLALLPVLTGAPLVMTPMLIALLELIIDPTCSIVLEAEPAEPDVMSRPPRDPRAPLIPGGLAAWGVVQGVLALLVVAAVYLHARQRGLDEAGVRLSVLIALVSANLALVLGNRGFGASLGAALGRPNPALWSALGATVAVLAGLIAWPTARGFLGIAPADGLEVATGVAGGAVLLLILQLAKWLRGHWQWRWAAALPS